MRALLLHELHQALRVDEHFPEPRPARGDVLVQVRAAALNHRDVWITQGQYANIRLPVILGSDGAGEYRGRPVVINPSLDWGPNPAAQGKDYRVLGLPDNGTFAEQIAIPRRNIYPKPEHLDWLQAAALPLAGLTAWRALFTRCRLRPGERALISGIGGGVALTAMQFAIAAGADVFVTSGSDDKLERALRMGAKGGANYKTPDWDKQLKKESGGFDVIIDSAAGDGFASLLALCNPGARMGVYGGSLGKINGLSPQILFWKQVSILGSTMGTHADFKQMLAFVNKHRIVPVVDQVLPLEAANLAFERMARGDQFGKIVLEI